MAGNRKKRSLLNSVLKKLREEKAARVDYVCPHCGGTSFKIEASVDIIVDKNDDNAHLADKEQPFHYCGYYPATCTNCGTVFDELDDVMVEN